MQAVGSGALGIASLALNRYVDSQTGVLVEPIPLRDLPQLMRPHAGPGRAALHGGRAPARRAPLGVLVLGVYHAAPARVQRRRVPWMHTELGP
jgi:hypothetical protein